MQLSIKGKQIDVGDALRTHVETHLKEITGKYFSESLDAHVTFSREAHLYRADITVHAGRGITLQAIADAGEPYPAFDLAAGRIQERLRRYKNKIKHHHQHDPRSEEALHARSIVLHGADHGREEEANENPVIVAEMTTPIAMLTVSEAVMRLDLSEAPALMFRNRANGGLNMIYRRADGNIGWVDPANTLSATQSNSVAPEAAKARA